MEQICETFDLLPWNLNHSRVFWIAYFLIASQIPVYLLKTEQALRRKHPQTSEALGSLIRGALPLGTIWRLAKRSYKTKRDSEGEAFVDSRRARLLMTYPLETILMIILGLRLFCWGLDAGYV